MSTDLSAVIAEVREKANIVNVVSDYVPIKPKGKTYWGLCPFHNEKSPSFSVTPQKSMFYCFGCGAGGDVFSFIQKIGNISFFDALKILAERTNVRLPEKDSRYIHTSKQRQEVAEANRMACDFYHSCLVNTSYGKDALRYLEERALDTSSITKFSIGYAPNLPDKLSNALLKRGLKAETLIKSGLAHQQANGKLVDVFRNRIIIPIFDTNAIVVAFGGRALADVQPKYLNSADTELFSKRNVLFGLTYAVDAIKREDCCILVEGYFDAISLAISGIENVVAGMGTALSERQATLLAKHSRNVLLCYDNDEAGKRAALRAFTLLNAAGVRVRVLDLKDKKDPDDYVRYYGVEQLKNAMKASKPILQHFIDNTLGDLSSTNLESRVQKLELILEYFSHYPHQIELGDYFSSIASKLNIDEIVVREEYSKRRRGIDKSKKNRDYLLNTLQQNEIFFTDGEKQIFSTFINYPALRATISEKFVNFTFSDEKIKDFWLALFNIFNRKTNFSNSDLQNEFVEQSDKQQFLSEILSKSNNYDESTNEKVVFEIFERNIESKLRSELEESIKVAEELEKAGATEYRIVLKQIAKLHEKLKQIRK